MASCDQCGATILFGGKSANGFRYCNDKCYEQGYLAPRLAAVPQNVFEAELQKFHSGPCPLCGGPGPVDVHTAHKIWSLIHICSWSSKPVVGCHACGRKAQILGLLFSMAAGWWSMHGLILTPVKIIANLKGILKPPDPQKPTPELQKIVRLSLAERYAPPTATAPATPISPIPQAKSTQATRPQPAASAPAPSKSQAPTSPFSDIGKPLN